MPVKSSLEDFINRAIIFHNSKYNYTKVVYINSHTPVVIICPIHGEFSRTPTQHLTYGCQKCYYESRLLTQEDFIVKASTAHKDMYSYDNTIYIDTKSTIRVDCSIHGPFYPIAQNHVRTRRPSGCPRCRIPKGELNISEYLTARGINFVQEKTYSDCLNPKTKRNLRYDFYLPDSNTLIEFNGSQHYAPTSFGSDRTAKVKQSNFEEIAYRDSIKNEYAIRNNIKLIIIPYKYINKISEILDKELDDVFY